MIQSTSQSCQINGQFTFFDLYREHTLCVYLAGFKKKRIPDLLNCNIEIIFPCKH